ncbi:response regulator [Luteolibacter pohnpeiensis]|uniref:histidine kinase n=1 Tax=Luteolibacter pohnpeiensis TaxID=454153 RepID=A0A934S7G3_9BACT|nr:response regulator [Luteolibacter pohnpeiensis]MBK1882196.1 response regulator [Luteolibacter pohnpeiensis]
MTPDRKIKFLLVDDLEANLLALEELIKRDGLEVLKARSGPEALELLLAHDVALAFLDVQMPGMSGFELAEIMRGTNRTRNVPIIFLTAGVVDQDRRIRGYETGAVDFLPKPIDPGNLLTKAATFFELARQREELRESETRLRIANEQLAHRNQALAEADRNKDQFLAVLAHELRNPLAPILMGLDMVDSVEGCPDQVTELARMMRRQMGQMVHLINDLLDVSRINTGKISLKREKVTLASVLDEAVEASRPLIDAQHHELVFVPVDESMVVDVDRHRLSQVISNLLSNAAKYTPAHGRVELCTEVPEEGWVKISVRDNGEGITADAQERIFKMFEQIDSSRQNGLGIGLTLVKNLVEMHGGSISVFSEGAGKGSEFSVSLPLLEGGEIKTAQQDEKLIVDAEKLHSARAMVVDDGKSIADMLAMFLQSEGVESKTAYDGKRAVSLAKEFKPHIVFMDLGMPEMDGYQAAREIRKDDSEVILIALSGWDRPEDRQRSAEAGFDGHAAKPVTPNTLREFLSMLEH